MRVCLAVALVLIVAVPLSAQVVVVNSSVTDQVIDVQRLAAMFQGRETTWSDGQSVVIVLAADPAADLHLNHVAGRDRLVLLKSWKRLVFAGAGAMPLSANNREEALAVVAKTAGAMVVLDQAPADPRWRVIPLRLAVHQ